MRRKTLKLIKNDPWLEPFTQAIEGRHNDALQKLEHLTNGSGKLKDFAKAHLYYGLHRTAEGGWVLREWAPNATDIYVVGDFNHWRECAPYRMRQVGNGNWELQLPDHGMHHGELYKFIVHWRGGQGERIPAYATRVVQDPTTHIFAAQVWSPEQTYQWRTRRFKPRRDPVIYTDDFRNIHYS